MKDIVLYDAIHAIAPIRVHEDGRFVLAKIPYRENREKFAAETAGIIHEVKKIGGIDALQQEFDSEERHDIIFVSAVPELYFTGVALAQRLPQGSSYPLITVGKAVERGERWVMPVALTAHHGFVDGFHAARLLSEMERYLTAGF